MEVREKLANPSKGSTQQQTCSTRTSLKKYLLTCYQSSRLGSACLPAPGQISSHYFSRACTSFIPPSRFLSIRTRIDTIYKQAKSYWNSMHPLRSHCGDYTCILVDLICFSHHSFCSFRRTWNVPVWKRGAITSLRVDSSQTASLAKLQTVFVIFVMFSNVSGFSCGRSHH